MAEEFNLSIYNDVYDMSFNQETEEIHIELKQGYYPLSNNVDLSNYYTKNETYNKNEVNSLISDIEVDLSNYYNKSESNLRYKSINYVPNWGEIQGNISNQTDLQEKFDNYVPYDGANKDIVLDNISLKYENEGFLARLFFDNDGNDIYITHNFLDKENNAHTYFKHSINGLSSNIDFSNLNTGDLLIYAQRQYVHNIAETKQDKLNADVLGIVLDNELSIKMTPSADDEVVILDSITGGAATIKYSTFGENKADLVDGKIPASQLPSYVDDVLEFANLASFPTTGENGKIYIALDTNLTYRWGGSSYVVMSSSLALGETSSTAYRGDRGKIAYDHSQVTHDKNLVGLGNVDNTSDLDKPISTATQIALNLKLSTEAPSTTGTVISFSTDKVYGTLTTPETGNITADVTNAKLGVTNIIIHNSGTAPTFGSEFKKLSGSGDYVTGVVNYIYCTFISNTEIIYSINQRS